MKVSYANLGPLGWRLFKQYVAAIARNLRQNTAYTEVQCGACPYDHRCCSLPVWITPFEAFGINWFLNVTTQFKTAKWKARILNRAKEYLAVSRGKTGVEADRLWYEKGKLCVFYDKGCSIYPARPLACRTLYSVDNCNSGHWVVPQADEEMLRRLIGFAVVRQGSTWRENMLEMNTMLAQLIQHPDKIVLSTGGPSPLFNLIQRVKTEVISDSELLYAEEPHAERVLTTQQN